MIATVFTQAALADWSDATYWKGNAANTNWNDNNWYNSTKGWDNHNPNYEGGRDLIFDNNTHVNMGNNFSGSGTGRWRLRFIPGAGTARTIRGTTENTFYDSSGNMPKIENTSAGSHTIAFPIKAGYSSGLEINAIDADLTISGNIDNNNYNLLLYGANDKLLTLSGVVSGTGQLRVRPDGGGYHKVLISGASTYSGTTLITEGELWVGENGTISGASAGAVEVGSSSYQNDIAKFYISDSNGGTTVNETFTVRAGSASENRVIGGLNTSGENTFSGTITLDDEVTLEAYSGGQVNFSGIISGAQNVYIRRGGSVVFSANHSYSGITYVETGSVTVATGGSLGSGSDVYLSVNGVVTAAVSATVASLRERGTSNSGTAVIGSGATLTVNGANKGTFYMNSISGAGTLTMNGSGTTDMQLFGTQRLGTINITGAKLGYSSGTWSVTNTVIAGGGTFDVSGSSGGLTFGAQGLVISAAGSASRATVSTSSGKNLTLGSTSSLTFTNFANSGSPMTVTGTGSLSLNASTTINIHNTSGSALVAGTYDLIEANVIGSAPSSVTITGSGIASGAVAALSISSGKLVLTVTAQPATQASSVSFSSVSATAFTINFNAGSGAGRIVLVKSGSPVDSNPVDGVGYSANSTFLSGTQIGSGNYVVFDGSGTSVTVTGLTASTTYHVAVYEYSTYSSTLKNYRTSDHATGNQATSAGAAITVQSGDLTFSGTVVGSASAEQSYTVSAVGLSANVTITAPTGFEISTTSGSSFGSSVTLTQSGGNVASTIIYVRFAPATATSFDANITHTSSGAGSQNKRVTGTGLAVPAITRSPASLTYTTMAGTTPAAQTFTVTNSGGMTLYYTNTVSYSSGSGWLTIAPPAGTNIAGSSVAGIHTATVSVAGLAAGSYSATINIAGNSNSSASVSVSLTVTNIPGPTASVTADGSELNRLTFSDAASRQILVLYRSGSDLSAGPSQNTAYSVGDSLGSGTVIYKGSGAYLDHVVAAGTTHYYRFYSIDNNHYSAVVSANTTTPSYRSGVKIEQAGYTNGVNLNGLGGGSGWSGSWSESSAGAFIANTNSTTATFVNMASYPNIGGQRIRMTDRGNNGRADATRSFTAITSGKIYLAYMLSYQFSGANKWAGVNLMSGSTEKAFFGELGSADKTLGIGGVASATSSYNLNDYATDGGNVYLVVGMYDFSTRELKTKAYYRTTPVTLAEPSSWDATATAGVGDITSIDGIRLNAGTSDAFNTLGQAHFDEIRVATSWADLMGVDAPVATAYTVNGGTTANDGQLNSGNFSVAMSFFDASGLATSGTSPNYDILNAAGTQVVTDRTFSASSRASNGTILHATNATQTGIGSSGIDIGTYSLRFSADNSNSVSTINSTTLSNGNSMTFTVSDDDSTGPSHSSFAANGVALSGALFTNTALSGGLNVTGFVTDAESGVFGGTSNMWTLFRSGTLVNSGSFSAQFSDGSCISSNGRLTASIAYADVLVAGVYTLRVSSANYDIDRGSADISTTSSEYAFTVTGAVSAAISRTPASLSFASMNGNTPAGQSFVVTNSGGGTLVYTNSISYSSGSGWLTVSPLISTNIAGTSAANSHTVTVSVASLTPGTTYNATINIAGNSNLSSSISVSMTYSNVPGPTASVTGDGSELNRLTFSDSNGRQILVVARAGSDLSANPTGGSSYNVGDSLGSGTVIYKGSGTYLDRVVSSGTTHYYRFYSIDNNYYSAAVSANAVMPSYQAGVSIEQSGYTNNVTLTGLNGGSGWSGAWSQSAVGAFIAWTNSSTAPFVNMASYPNIAAQRIRMTDRGNGGTATATRSFNAVTSGKIYVSYMLSYQYSGANKYAGINLMSGSTEKAFFGEIGGSDKKLGLDGAAGGAASSYDLNDYNTDNGNVYLVVGVYDFTTREMKTKAFYRTTSVPLSEPISWDATVTAGAGVISSIDGIRLSAGCTDGANTLGIAHFDEIRVATSWADLMDVDAPVATAYAVNGGTTATDGQLDSGSFSVAMSFFDASGLSSSGTSPNYDILNAAGTQIVTDRTFTASSRASNGTVLHATNVTQTAIPSAGIDLGTYNLRFSADNSNSVSTINSTTLSNGTTMTFTVSDDDTAGPVFSGMTVGSGSGLTDAQILAGGWAFTGLIQDAGSGIDATGSAGANPYPPHYDILNPSGTEAVDNGLFGTTPADGGGLASPAALAVSSMAAISSANNALGTWTARVYAADNDNDRTGDRSGNISTTSFTVSDDDTSGPSHTSFTGNGTALSGASIGTDGVAGGVVVTGFVQDAQSGVYSGSNTFTLTRNGVSVQTGSMTANFTTGQALGSAGQLTATLTAANVAGVYTMRVTSVNYDIDRGNADNESTTTSFAFTIVETGAPSTPTASAATSVSYLTFTANWSASGGATNYILTVATDAAFASPITGYNNLSVGNVTSYSVTVPAVNRYFYRVVAQNSSGSSLESGTITVNMSTAAGRSATASPASLFVGDTMTTVVETWGQISGAARGRTVIRNGNADINGGSYGDWGASDTIELTTNVSPRFTSSGTWYWGVQMDYGASYGTNFWMVRNTNTWVDLQYQGTNSQLSVTVSAINNPSAISATLSGSDSQGSIVLSWTRNAQSHDVMVVRSADSSFITPTPGTAYTNNQIVGSDVVVYRGSATTITNTGLSASTAYYYKMFSENWSYYSSGVETGAITTAGPGPGIPTVAAASSISTNSFVANWGSATNATSYRLDVSTSSGFLTFVSGYSNLTVAGTSRTVSGLTPGVNYHYRVRGVNANGTSGNSGTTNVSTAISAFITPATVATTNATFNATSGAEYTKYYSDDGGVTWHSTGTVTAVGGTVSVSLEEGNSSNRIFTVKPSGVPPSTADADGATAVIKTKITAGTGALTLMSAPYDSDLNLAGTLGSQLADGLSTGSKVLVMSAGGAPSWTEWTLQANGTWSRTSGGGSAQLSSGQAFFLQNNGNEGEIRFTGQIDTTSNNKTNSLQTGFNLISVSEGKAVAASTAFESASPTSNAGGDFNQADQVVIQNSDGSWRRLMRRSDGTWYDTANPNSPANTSLQLQPGQGYYYIRRGGNANLTY